MAELMDNMGAALEVPRLQARTVSESGENKSLFEESETYGFPVTLPCLGIDWNQLDISEFETTEPLGILVELARGGKIDPWDIDIVQLTDSFLGRVEELKQMDLRISSRTLLYSAILLRMKSSEILNVEEEEGEAFDPDFPDDPDFPEPAEFPVPKLPVRRVSTRPVTLNELILELKKAEKCISRKNEKKASQVSEESDPRPKLTTGDVLGIAHDEAISSRLSLMWERLAELFTKQSVVVFSSLLERSEDRIMDYLSLLFLASSRKIWLFQNELFEELYIYPGEESGFSTEANPSLFHEMLTKSKAELLKSEINGSSGLDSAEEISPHENPAEEPELTVT
ncbi:segregation and condensation protein A [Methanosarcina sp. UBA5]|uniref:segregation and condensation protein A n=1 Tax=Methanosarcina sp. UBA5 TaxID=1915593 RepID=UPI0025E3E9F5|nr:ScpA family protein [Methanosarcina sp. UBA5]